MMKIQHRVNTIASLSQTPLTYGVELDLRDSNKKLLVSHDPYSDGEEFEDYIKHFKHQFMIANIKSEGVEMRVLELLKKYKVQHYFFLDLSFPALIKLVKQGETKIALRFSEYEPIESALSLKGKIEWVWVDCFHNFPLNEQQYSSLKSHFKLCLVSPELQGHAVELIETFKKKMSTMPFDAVCTKYPELWN